MKVKEIVLWIALGGICYMKINNIDIDNSILAFIIISIVLLNTMFEELEHMDSSSSDLLNQEAAANIASIFNKGLLRVNNIDIQESITFNNGMCKITADGDTVVFDKIKTGKQYGVGDQVVFADDVKVNGKLSTTGKVISSDNINGKYLSGEYVSVDGSKIKKSGNGIDVDSIKVGKTTIEQKTRTIAGDLGITYLNFDGSIMYPNMN